MFCLKPSWSDEAKNTSSIDPAPWPGRLKTPKSKKWLSTGRIKAVVVHKVHKVVEGRSFKARLFKIVTAFAVANLDAFGARPNLTELTCLERAWTWLSWSVWIAAELDWVDLFGAAELDWVDPFVARLNLTELTRFGARLNLTELTCLERGWTWLSWRVWNATELDWVRCVVLNPRPGDCQSCKP